MIDVLPLLGVIAVIVFALIIFTYQLIFLIDIPKSLSRIADSLEAIEASLERR